MSRKKVTAGLGFLVLAVSLVIAPVALGVGDQSNPTADLHTDHSAPAHLELHKP